MKYNAAGGLIEMQYDNGLWESTTFNSRLQPEQIALGTSQNGTNKLQLNYGYGSSQNNGNVMSQTITVPGLAQPFVQNYTYDELNRLKTATETNNGAQTWTQVFGYDRYGNRNITSGLGATNFSFSGNRITAHSYDSAGNTLNFNDGTGRTFTYDAENKQKTAVVNGYTNEYFYDGDGRRVKKVVPSTGETTIFVYDAFGKLVAEYSTIIEPAATAKVAYLTNDHLGSPRINTDLNGTVTARHDYHPFGEEISTSQRTAALGYSADTVRKQFTGYERDNESGLDFAQARYSSFSLGRFTSPDSLSGRLLDPQTLNKYVYVRNNPLIFIDPTGDELVLIGDGAGDYLNELAEATGYALKRCTSVDAKQGCKKIGQVLIDSTQKRKTGKGISDKLADKLKSVIDLKDNRNRDVTVGIKAIKDGNDTIAFDSYGKRTVDVADLQVAKSKEGGATFVAGQLAHVLEEYSQADLLLANEPFASMNDPSGSPVTHQEGLDFEGDVLSELTGVKVEARDRYPSGIPQTPYSYLSLENGKDGFRYTVYWGEANRKTVYTVQDVKRIAIPR